MGRRNSATPPRSPVARGGSPPVEPRHLGKCLDNSMTGLGKSDKLLVRMTAEQHGVV